MKSIGMLAAVFAMVMAMVFIAAAPAEAGTKCGCPNKLLKGLVNVVISDVEVDIETGDITLVNVKNVLNQNDINILNVKIANNTIASHNQQILTNLLRNANILTNNQVVVGVLSGQIVFQNV